MQESVQMQINMEHMLQLPLSPPRGESKGSALEIFLDLGFLLSLKEFKMI